MHCYDSTHNALLRLYPQCTVTAIPTMHCYDSTHNALLQLYPQSTVTTLPTMHCYDSTHNALLRLYPQYTVTTLPTMHCYDSTHNTLLRLYPQCTVTTLPTMHCYDSTHNALLQVEENRRYRLHHLPQVEKSSMFRNSRSVILRHGLGKGRYCVVPTTFEAKLARPFLLRIYTSSASSAM